MSTLVTRCPHCGTAFRAQHSQLTARGGMVRCGKCAAVFDGVAHLIEESAATGPLSPIRRPVRVCVEASACRHLPCRSEA